jgi:outer membrane autotransporter protein
MGPGMYAALSATQRQNLGLAPFIVMGGGTSRYNTGSHVDVDGFSLMMGMAWRAAMKSGSLVTGVFLESGWGSYDSYNSFNNAPSVKGKGDTRYYGGGILGRYDAPIGLYGEGSLRAGRTDTDFRSGDILNSSGGTTRYDSDSTYYGAHLGAGYVWNINKASLDLSAKYIWTRQGSDSVVISGDVIDFDAANSHRWRSGGRFSYALMECITPYTGAYYEYEFSGKAKARANGNSIATPDLKGSTGVGELGLILTPAKGLPFSLDLGVQGYVGKREGVTGSLRGKYEF